MTPPKTEAERIEQAALEYTEKLCPEPEITWKEAGEAFKAGVAWRDANPIEVDDHEQFKKDLDDHHRTWGSAHDRHFTDGWKKCRNYKFKLKLRDANPLPHPDEEFFVTIIEKWKFTWMDVKGTDEKDRESYYRRAHLVDANMKYSLARMLVKAMKQEQLK